MSISNTFLEKKYINFLGPNLELFKKTTENVWNFRCPICGDSKTNKFKKRGYIFEKNGSYFVKCHNCGFSSTFKNFLKKVNPSLFREFQYEQFKEVKDVKSHKEIFKDTKETIKYDISIFNELKTINELDDNHYIKQYILGRKIPKKYYDDIYFCEKFVKFTNNLIANKLDEAKVKEHSRIIIPLIYNECVIGFQARSFHKDQQRYITIMLNNDCPKVFGYDNINKDKPVYVVEGPFDSMFLKNSIAVCGSDILSIVERLNIDKENIIIVFDNEYKSPTIVNKIRNAINNNYKTVIFPSNIVKKDINEMYIHNINIVDIVKDNVYVNLRAHLELNKKAIK